MEKKPEDGVIDGLTPSRVVVLIDASPDALRALETAAELARHHAVPLLAVSVEEPDHSRSAAFSFAREVGAVSGNIRPIDEGFATGRRERAPAAIRRAVERVVREADLVWELLVLRGRLVEEVLALSRPGDCLMLGRVGWSARLGRKLGRAPLILARRAGGTVQICSAAPARQRGRVAVLVEDLHSAGSMLALAAARARTAGRELTVLLPPSFDGDHADRIAEALGTTAPRWRVRTMPAMNTGEMLRALAEERAVELVVQRGGDWLDTPAADNFLAYWPLPVLITP